MADDGGYIRTYWKSQDSIQWTNAESIGLWEYLKIRAAIDRQVVPGGIVVERGQVWCSLRALEDRLKLSRMTISRYLTIWERDGAIKMEKLGRNGTIITLCNFDGYQSIGREGGTKATRNRPEKKTQPTSKRDASIPSQRDLRDQSPKSPDLEANASCSEPASPASEPDSADDPNGIVMEFPVSGDKEHPTWGLKRSKAREYVESFPGIDVKAELLKARQWCRDNVTNRKTASGMPKFLGAWLNKAQNESARNQRGSPVGAKSRGQVATENFLARHKQAQHGQSGMRLLGSEPDLRSLRPPSG